jgi:excisionase family DNA binding protein
VTTKKPKNQTFDAHARCVDGAMSVQEIGAFLGLSDSAVRLMMNEGRLPWFRSFGRKRAALKSDVIAYLKRVAQEGGAL